MDLASAKNVKNLLKNYQVFPSKWFGQNFLVDKTVLLKIIEVACLKPKDIVLEIGPGVGTLTQEIAKRVRTAIAIEKDPKMVEILRETTKSQKNVKIVQGDILKILDYQLPKRKYKIVANLPYYIVAPVIRKFLEADKKPKEMILMVQKEVAQRIVARPPDMNLLAVSVQFYARPKIICFVSKKSFWPQPKVDGAIIKISNIKNQKSKIDKNLFFKIVKAGFSQPRKQLVNNLSKMLKLDKPRTRTSSVRGREKVKTWLLKNGINPSQRAETLSLEHWTSLTKDFPFTL